MSDKIKTKPSNKKYREGWDRVFNNKRIINWSFSQHKEGSILLRLIYKNLNHKFIEFSSEKDAEDYIIANFG